MNIEKYYNETFTVIRNVEAKDSNGDKVIIETLIDTIIGLREDISGQLKYPDEKLIEQKLSVFYTAINPLIKVNDFIVTSNNDKYEIDQIENPIIKGHHLEIYGKYIK